MALFCCSGMKSLFKCWLLIISNRQILRRWVEEGRRALQSFETPLKCHTKPELGWLVHQLYLMSQIKTQKPCVAKFDCCGTSMSSAEHRRGSRCCRVVSGSRDATLRVWDIETGQCLHVLMGHVAAVRCVQYDGRRVVSGAYDFMVKVWDPETETCLHTLQGHTNRVYSLQVCAFYLLL